MEKQVSITTMSISSWKFSGIVEVVVGHHHRVSTQKSTAFTKWCPAENGIKTFQQAEEAVNRALASLCQSKIALMQYHVWDYTDDTYIHNLSHLHTLQMRGKIQHIGLTNADAAHLELLIHSGFTIITNQVSCSVIDSRSIRRQLSSVCLKHGVKILAYCTLLGGYLSERWLGKPEPGEHDPLNWSLSKYVRFIHAAGGWAAFQVVLQALDVIAKKHRVAIAAVAIRYVLDLPAVGAVIVGSRLSAESDKYTLSNLAAFSFSLDEEDQALIAKAQTGLTDVPGDCGDEYRRPPYLTASGDLSHHLSAPGQHIQISKAVADGKRIEYSSGNKWEPLAGYCRAVRTGNVVRVSGTTANSPIGSIAALGGKNARSQAVAALDIITHALTVLGASLADVVRTRIILRREEDCEEVALAHGWAFECVGVRPANTTVVSGIIGDDFLVEIEAEAELGFMEVLRI